MLLSLLIVVATAWVGRVLLDARELGWGRLLLAAVLGIGVGDSAGVLLLASDPSELRSIDYRELTLVALPFRIVGTMGAIVVLELALRRRRDDRGRATRRRLLPRPRLLWRALRVSRVLTRHGLAPLVGWGSGRGATLSARDLA